MWQFSTETKLLHRVVDPDPDWIRIGSGSMAKKNEEKNALFLDFVNIFIAKR
jgi:hypothetical protein